MLHIPIISIIVIYLVVICFKTFTHTSLINFRKVNYWGMCKEKIVVKIQAFYNFFLIYCSIWKHTTNFLPHVTEPSRVRTSITSFTLCLIIAFCSISCMHKHIRAHENPSGILQTMRSRRPSLPKEGLIHLALLLWNIFFGWSCACFKYLSGLVWDLLCPLVLLCRNCSMHFNKYLQFMMPSSKLYSYSSNFQLIHLSFFISRPSHKNFQN